MVAKLKAAGAHNVIQEGATWADADRYLREVCLKKDPKGVYVPPFDHPDVWAGHASLIPELVSQLGGENGIVPKAVVCSVGGGGLLCGIKEGLEKAPAAWSDVNAISVETYGAESLYAAVEADELVTLPGITSQATSLGAVRVAEKAFEYARKSNTGANPVKCMRVSDDQAAAACVAVAEYERAVVELSCGASVAAVLDKKAMEAALGREVDPNDVVVVILCGGSSVTVEMLAAWREAARK
jgi:L-serine/L-threonine ammonia-lyase